MQLALPDTSDTLPHSTTLSCVAKLSVPVGVVPVTVAFIVNGWSSTNVVMHAVVSDVVVGFAVGSTCCVSVFEMDTALFASPLYVAVIACGPADNDDVAHDALPLPNAPAAQIVVVPSLNVTLPVGD